MLVSLLNDYVAALTTALAYNTPEARLDRDAAKFNLIELMTQLNADAERYQWLCMNLAQLNRYPLVQRAFDAVPYDLNRIRVEIDAAKSVK